MGFADSSNFRVEDGVVKHRRDGLRYMDRLMDGVGLDKSLKWDSEVMVRLIFLDDKEEIVGERAFRGDIDETHKEHNKNKGEKKFKRKRRIPVKNKKYPTKPKRWNKRLSKVANHIDLNHVFVDECECDGISHELNEKYWEEKEKKDKRINDIYSICDRYWINNTWDYLYDSSDPSSESGSSDDEDVM